MPNPFDAQLVAVQQALIGRYSIERVLGRGGMGTVYLAREVRLERLVALKVLHPELAAVPARRARFLAEARIAARLAHPHIIPIYAVEERDELVYFAMALVDGASLGERLRRRGAMKPQEVERVLREIAWALGYAHAHDVLHRDITPENILIDRDSGRAMLADFGIADEGAHVESDAPSFGTPGFLAPEVIRGDAGSCASDLYALGAVGYLMLTGSAPFVADSSAQLLVKHLVQPLPPLAPRAPSASRRLTGAIECCLAKDPEARPSDMATFIGSLDRAADVVTIAAPLRKWFGRWERIRPIHAVAAPLLGVQTFALVQVYWKSGAGGTITAATLEAILTITAIPAAIQLWFEFRELRQLRAAGFTINDIRVAAPHWRAEIERDRHGDELRPLVNRVIFDLTGCAGALLAFNQLVLGTIMAIAGRWALGDYLTGLYYMSDHVYLAAMIGAGASLASPGYRFAPHGFFRRTVERFWRSRLASRAASVAGVLTHGTAKSGETLHRPTEMVLGLAIDDLWRALTPALRSGLGDVPSLAATLQGSAEELRVLADRLRDSEQQLPQADLEREAAAATRGELERHHRDSVKALEQLRMHLLRLLATQTQTADLHEHLAHARDLEATLSRDIAGHADVRRLLRPTSRPVAIIPTPSTA